MAARKRNVGREILDGLRELKRGRHGRVTNVPDVAGIREKTGLTQARFAALLGVSVRTGSPYPEWLSASRSISRQSSGSACCSQYRIRDCQPDSSVRWKDSGVRTSQMTDVRSLSPDPMTVHCSTMR